MGRALVVLLALSLVLSGSGAGQELRVEGTGPRPIATRLQEVIQRRQYRVLDRDTILSASESLPGDVVIAGAVVRLEGRVLGSVVVLPRGELFLRPGGAVGGAVLEVGGAAYLSENASVGERFELPASFDVEVERQGGVYTLRLFEPPPAPIVGFNGLFGIGLPTYDRVNGATYRVGGWLRLAPDTAAPALSAAILYRQERESFAAEASFTVPLGVLRAVATAARRTETNDAWIRGDLSNSLSALLLGSDARNYYEADLAALTVERAAPGALDEGEGFAAPRIRIGISRAKSLPSRDPWTLLGEDEWRANPPIDSGTIVSGMVGLASGWRGTTTTFAGDLSVEWAPPGVGDFDFSLLTADGRWTMAALWGHSIELRGHFLYPLGTSAPPQRWSILGGPLTLPTLATGELRGDHLLFLESTYLIPVPRMTLPFIGSPSVTIRHAVGSAWASDDPTPPFEQNLGMGLAFPLARVNADFDPTDLGEIKISVAATLPL